MQSEIRVCKKCSMWTLLVETLLQINWKSMRCLRSKTIGCLLHSHMIQRSKKIKTLLKSGDWCNNKEVYEMYALKRRKLYKVTSCGLRWVVPKANRFQILRITHDDVGHFAFDKTYDLISNKFWFRKMRSFALREVKRTGFYIPFQKLQDPSTEYTWTILAFLLKQKLIVHMCRFWLMLLRSLFCYMRLKILR